MCTNNTKGKTKFVHGTDKLLFEFMKICCDKNNFHNGLLYFILHRFVAKFGGVNNKKYAAHELNFHLDLAASGNHKGYIFVSGNLVLIFLFHARRVFINTRITPFINLTINETVEKL